MIWLCFISQRISFIIHFKSAKKVEYLRKELINYFGKDGTIAVQLLL